MIGAVVHSVQERNMKIVFVVNVDWFFVSHRLPLAKHAIERGDEVYLLTADTGRKAELESIGIHFVDIPFERSGSNPLHEIKCIKALQRAYRKIKPDVIHHITLKASLLGCFAAKRTKQKSVVNAISGFGYMFTEGRKGMMQTVVKKLIHLAFKSNSFSFILQNPDDIKVVRDMKLVPDNNIFLIKGSGVDLNEYKYYEPQKHDKVNCLFPARILRDKGVVEFIQAAMQLKDKYEGKVEFVLAGDCDEENPAVLHESELKSMLIPGYIEWVGYQKKMIPVYMSSDIVVLPSYREGLPKSLIEACAIGRPIVTTNAIGCRECVSDGENGFLVPIKDSNSIATALVRLFNDEDLRLRMGKKSRELAERDFSIDSVVEKTFAIYLNYFKQ